MKTKPRRRQKFRYRKEVSIALINVIGLSFSLLAGIATWFVTANPLSLEALSGSMRVRHAKAVGVAPSDSSGVPGNLLEEPPLPNLGATSRASTSSGPGHRVADWEERSLAKPIWTEGVPRETRALIPVPDPDPPEPLLPEISPHVYESADVADVVFGIPDAPPATRLPDGPINVGGDVQKPEKIDAPQPQYTEVARKARIQGVVIVQAVVDKQGNISDIKVLKGLPLGLSEEAVKAIRQWRFKPATLKGEPVAVYYNATVNFRLQ